MVITFVFAPVVADLIEIAEIELTREVLGVFVVEDAGAVELAIYPGTIVGRFVQLVV